MQRGFFSIKGCILVDLPLPRVLNFPVVDFP